MHIVLLYRYHLTFPLDCLYGRSQLMPPSLEQYNFKVRKPSKLKLRHKLHSTWRKENAFFDNSSNFSASSFSFLFPNRGKSPSKLELICMIREEQIYLQCKRPSEEKEQNMPFRRWKSADYGQNVSVSKMLILVPTFVNFQLILVKRRNFWNLGNLSTNCTNTF